MALTVSNLGTNSSTSTASLAVTASADTQAGDWIVVAIACPNNGLNGAASPVKSITDEDGNTYEVYAHHIYDPGAAAAGCSVILAAARVAGDVDTVTVTFGATTPTVAAALYRVRPDGGDYITYAGNKLGNGSSSTSQTTGAVSVTSGDTIIGAVSIETDDAITADSDTTNGNWSTIVTVTSDAGGDTSAQTLSTQWKTVSGTGNQTYNTATGTARDFVAAAIILHPVTGTEPSAPSAVTKRGSAVIDGSASAATTGAFTPGDGSLLVAIGFLYDDAADITTGVTISDSLAGTWTAQQNVGQTASGHSHIYVATRPITTGASMTVSVNHTGSVQAKHLHVFQVDDPDASPFGVSISSATLGGTTGAMTLSGSPDASSIVFAARFLGTDDNEGTYATPGTGWFEGYELDTDDRGGSESQYITGKTDTAVAWLDVNALKATVNSSIGLAFEIVTAGTPAAYVKPTYVGFIKTTDDGTSTPRDTTSTIAVTAGDIIVACLACESGDSTPIVISASDSDGNTYTEQKLNNVDTNQGYNRVLTAPADASVTLTGTVTNSFGASRLFSGAFLVFRDSDGVGASAKSDNGTGSGSPTINLTTTQDNSAVVVCVCDWNAVSGTSTFGGASGTPTEVVDYGDDAHYAVHTAYYDDVGTAGAKTFSMSAPATQRYMIIAVEIKGEAGVAGAQPYRKRLGGVKFTPGYGVW